MKKLFLFMFICLISSQAFPQLRLSGLDSITHYQPGLIFPVQIDSIKANHDTVKVWRKLEWQNLLRLDSAGAFIVLDSLGIRLGNQDSTITEIDTVVQYHGRWIIDRGYLIDTHTAQLSILDTAINSRVTEWNYYRDKKGVTDTLALLQTDITQLSDLIQLRALKTQLNRDTLMSYINISPSSVKINGPKVDITTNSDYASTKGRVTTAESNIDAHTTEIYNLAGNITALSTTVGLKANITSVDSIRNRVTTAEAGIVANANNIGSVTSSLLLYAKKDSIISKINISPESIKINTDKLNVYGIIKAFNGTGDSTVVDGSKIKTGTLTVDKLIEISSTSGGKKATLTGGGLQFSNGAFNIQLDNNGSAAQFSNDLQVVGNLDVEYDITASNITVNPEAYGSGWNADQTVATKQDIYNKIQTLQAADSDLDDLADGTLTGSKVGTGINFSNITVNKPTTIAGYGITDGLSSSNTYYGSAIGTNIWVSEEENGPATINVVAFPVYINGTLHYLLAY